jgi:hypothetical protein
MLKGVSALRGLVVLALVLCAPGVSKAELTWAERNDVRNLIESARALRNGERYLIEAIKCCSAEARPVLATVLGRFYGAQIDHWRALAFILHTGTEAPVSKPAFTDAEWLSQAWFHIDRYRDRLDDITDGLNDAEALYEDHAGYQDTIRRIRTIWIKAARWHIDQMNPKLPYLDPWPASTDTIPNVVGPHGDYRRMQWYINRGKNYALDGYSELIAAYREGTAAGWRIRDAWVQSSNMLDSLDRATGLLADVTFTAEHAAEDRFCRALRVTKILTVESATRYQAWAAVVAGFIPGRFGTFFARLGDSWKHAIDLGSWQALVFPESARCTSPFLKN